MDIKKLVTWVVGAAALTLAACGGGGSSGGIGGTGGGSGGIGGTGVAYGTITDFGSVWVNGVEYNSGNATIRIDDTVHPESDLRRGMVVRVDGSVSGATASTITVDDAVKGLVEQVIDANRMVVMGQTVQIDNLTRFDNNVVPVQGDRVEVHGLIAGDGLIAAGYIEKKATAPTPPFAVKGVVKNHDSTAQTFQVGALTVQYNGTTVVSDMPGGPWNGLQVDVKGTACSGTAPVCGTLTASKVEPAGASVSSASQAEIEGIVVAVTVNGFTIGNQTVVTTASTRYEGGVAGDIAAGTKLEAEGSISGGVLTATKVSFRDAIRLEGDIATVNAGTGNLTLTGLPGVTVNVMSITELKNVASVNALAVGNHLRIRGKLGLNGVVGAAQLELRSADNRVELQAPASAVTPETSVTLLGISVSTTSVSSYQDLNDAQISRAAFFAAAKVNTLIKARGTLGGVSVTWNELQLEN
jgi:hypothetical protein